MESDREYLSLVFNLKSIICVSVMKGEEQDFKEMLQCEYRLRFRLMVEEEMSVRSLQECIFNPNLRKDRLNQLLAFTTELTGQSQEALQVSGGKLHAHSVWERRADHYTNSKMRHSVTTTHILKEYMHIHPTVLFLVIYLIDTLTCM